MILSTILKILKKTVDGVARAVAWLLLAFGLWVPLLYSLVYLIVVVIFLDVPLANTGTVYFIGLFISFLGALWFSMVRSNNEAKKRKRKKGVGYSISEVKKKRKIEDEEELDDVGQSEKQQPQYVQQPVIQQPQYVQQPASQQYAQQPQQHAQPYEQIQQQYSAPQYPQPAPQQQYGAPQYAPYGYAPSAPQPQYEQPQPQQYTQPQYEQSQTQFSQPQYEQPQQSYSQPQYSQPQYGNPQTQEPYSQEDVSFDFTQRQRRGYEESVSPWGRAERDTQSSWDRGEVGLEQDTNEQPRIFRLRSDPDMLVYEFSNRLEYYRKTVHGNLFVRRQYK